MTRKNARPACLAGNPAARRRAETAPDRARECGPRGSRILSNPATPGWSSRTARSRCASTLICSVHGRLGSTSQSTSASTPVEDQVLELLLAAHVAVERARDHPEAGGQVAHGQRLDALFGDDRQGLGEHALARERLASVLVAHGAGEP